ncbi:hypothetical protein BDF21DRAFT_493174 [Thamnidium elegans]|nr:hypothetical protein BDF21DRAFT_493174 [Thamnidium elegans]
MSKYFLMIWWCRCRNFAKLALVVYNLDSSQKIRTALGTNHQFHANYDKDINADEDWVNHVVYSLVREYEFENLDRHHNEVWYQSHIWSMTESCFDKVKGIEAVTGESTSLGSKIRMNQNRIPTAINMSRLAYGYKCDLVFRQYDNGHNTSLEFGGREAKLIIEGGFGSKFLQEGFLNLSFIQKDMLDVLLEKVGYDDLFFFLRTVGFIHSGLSCTMVELDRPTSYISRVSRGNKIKISNSVLNFGSTVLPATLSSWICCEIIKEILDIILSDKEENPNDTSWVIKCLERPALPNTPTTPSSSSSSSSSINMNHKRQKYQSSNFIKVIIL